MDINKKAKEIFEQNKAAGWWDDMDRCIYQTLQLVNTEIAEATEGARKDLMDDHLPHRKMEEVELADALIRMLDLGGRCGWEVDGSMKLDEKDLENCVKTLIEEGCSSGHLHLVLTMSVSDLAEILLQAETPYNCSNPTVDHAYTSFINVLIIISSYKGYDLFGAMEEKLEYNKNRLDHKRENRVKDGGKKF